jgi:homoserine dehydrogenase
MVKSDAAGITLHYGAGAGSEETASAVIADLVDLARAGEASARPLVPHLAFQSKTLHDFPVLPIADGVGCYYLRVDLAAGENEEVARGMLQRLAQAGVGVQSHALLPHHHHAAHRALTLISLPVQHAALLRSVQGLPELPCVLGVPTVLRVERLV